MSASRASVTEVVTPWSKLRDLKRRLRWVSHPITVFISLQVVWLAITLIWVIWFVGEQAELAQLAKSFGRQYFDSRTALAILIVGCVLLGMILVGTIVLFVFGQRQNMLAQQQRSFVSSVTHELKSPLASLQLGFETLNTPNVPPDAAATLKRNIVTDIQRLTRLVDQILVAGRLDRGVQVFQDELTDVNVENLISTVIDKHKYVDPDLTARVTVECPDDLIIRAGRGALQLMLGNLLENAVKYSPRGTPIKIEASTTDHHVLFSVQDNGDGLEGPDIKRVFKMFHRSDRALKKAVSGTGVGLYIVRTLARLSGGQAWAESEGLGQGSTFFITLPTRSRSV